MSCGQIFLRDRTFFLDRVPQVSLFVGSSARVGSFGAALVLASAAEARVGGESARNRLCHSGRK